MAVASSGRILIIVMGPLYPLVVGASIKSAPDQRSRSLSYPKIRITSTSVYSVVLQYSKSLKRGIDECQGQGGSSEPHEFTTREFSKRFSIVHEFKPFMVRSVVPYSTKIMTLTSFSGSDE